MIVREFKSSDENSVLEIISSAFSKGDTYPYDPDLSKKEFAEIWFSSDKKVFVAESEKAEILGTFYIKPNQPSLGSHICNAGFVVCDKSKGKGVGKAMAEFSLQKARELGYLAMQFNLVLADNTASLKIWENLGFSKIGLVPEAFKSKNGDFVDAYIIYKKL